MNRRDTEPYVRWCGRTAGFIPRLLPDFNSLATYATSSLELQRPARKERGLLPASTSERRQLTRQASRHCHAEAA